MWYLKILTFLKKKPSKKEVIILIVVVVIVILKFWIKNKEGCLDTNRFLNLPCSYNLISK